MESIIMLIIFWAIAGIVGDKKKKQRQAEQAKRTAQAGQQPQAAAPAQPQRRAFPTAADIFPDVPVSVKPKAKKPPKDDRFPELTPSLAPTPLQGSLRADSHEGQGSGRSMRVNTNEGSASAAYVNAAQSVHTVPQHVVKPLTESEHAHTESSMSAVEQICMDDTASATAQTVADGAYDIHTAAGARHFAFDRSSLVQGFLYGEILGKPKALRQ